MAKEPSYRLHKASGQAIVTLGGRMRYLGPHGSAESKRKFNRLMAEYHASKASFGVPTSDLTLTELCKAYKTHCESYYGLGHSSEWFRIKIGLRAARRLYGPTLAAQFGPLEYKATRHYVLEGKNSEPRVKGGKTKSGKPAKPARMPSRQYINALMKRVRRMFVWAAGEGILPAAVSDALSKVDPLKAGRCNAPERPKVKPVPDKVVEATLPHLPSVVADMVRFQKLVGCRPGEVCVIKPSLVDRTTDVWEIHLDKHKTSWRGKLRVLYVGPQAQKILAPYLLRDADEFCFRPYESERKRLTSLHAGRKTPLSCGNRPGHRSNTDRTSDKPLRKRKLNGCYSNGTYARAISRVCEREGITHWAPNQLRHSMATKVRKSDGLEAAQVILGHAEVGVTQVYAESDRSKAIEVVRRIG